MKIGLVVPGFSADASDWCIPALRHLARALAESDDVRVVATRYPYCAAKYSVDGAKVSALGGGASHGSATLDLWRRVLCVLRDEHRRQPFDVLHAFWATESGFLTALAGRWLRIPTLVSLAGGELVALPEIGYGDQRVAWERLKIHLSLRLASAVSAGSRHLVNLAARHVAAARVHRAPLGVPLDMFRPCTRSTRPDSRILHVGTLTRVKDQATLLRAFALLRAQVRDASLEIVGDGPLRADLGHLGRTLGVAEQVRFTGDLDHATLAAVYGTGRLFVLSSRHEAQGMVAVEAAACGRAVVGTHVGVVPELAGTPQTVVPVGDPRALGEALAATFADPTEHGRTALERARTEFGLEVCTARFRSLYVGIMDAC